MIDLGTPIAGLTGSVLQPSGEFVANTNQPVGADPAGVWLDLARCWITPGFVDAHSHLSWSAFDEAERSSEESQLTVETASNQLATLQAGVTSVRDAGGLQPALRRRLAGRPGPRVALSIDILGPADARGERQLRDRVAELIGSGASWIKIAATGGVGAGTRQLDPVFSNGELRAIIEAASAAGVPTLVHAWGGPAIDQAVAYGAASIEHAVHLTKEQAGRIAAAGAFVVPTVWIYHEVARLAAEAGLQPLGAAARRAVQAHPIAIRHCLEAGVRLALGTDAGLRSQHGRNLHEAAAMIDCGVPPAVALAAGTFGGNRLLQRSPDWTPRSDWVVFDADPTDPEVLRDPGRVVLVIQAGQVVHRRSE